MTKDLLSEKFLKIFEENLGVVIKISMAYTTSKHDREDLTNDITLELWRSFGNFKGDSKVSTWIYKVALNTAMNYKRKKLKDSFFSFQGDFKQEDHGNLLVEKELDDSTETEILYQCIDELNELNKALILLFLEGKSHEEISEITGISKSNVGTRISRIKDQIKNLAINKII